jgi:hypothetical protein
MTTRAADLDADLEFLMRVAQKVETIREDLGSYGTVLADDVELAMLGRGYSMPGVSRADTKVDPVRKMIKFERDLAKQIGELLDQYKQTQREPRLSPENVRKVVEVGLAIAELPPLIPIQHPSGKPVFTLPALKHSWAATAEGLEHPHTKEIRPITFDHAAADGRDDIVLAHLNHRLVQMGLRLLRAEVWSVKLLTGVEEKILYESALTVMMRLVFLFCAEERELLLPGGDLYDKNDAVSTLREQLRVTADQFGEEILRLRYDARARLLTSFRAVYSGAKHDRLKLPAYGGSLFNPDRFPFLEVWQLAVDLAEQCYQATRSYPKDELFAMTGQIRRAAASIPANIADGQGREHTQSFTTRRLLGDCIWSGLAGRFLRQMGNVAGTHHGRNDCSSAGGGTADHSVVAGEAGGDGNEGRETGGGTAGRAASRRASFRTAVRAC